jgi:hypothetical protein
MLSATRLQYFRKFAGVELCVLEVELGLDDCELHVLRAATKHYDYIK